MNQEISKVVFGFSMFALFIGAVNFVAFNNQLALVLSLIGSAVGVVFAVIIQNLD